MIAIHALLEEFRQTATDSRNLGDKFERLIANYLITDPTYSDRYTKETVWLWSEWQHRWGNDKGIDLVARDVNTGEYCAIQCKFYDPNSTISQSDIASFFTQLGKKFSDNEGEKTFSSGLIISTTNNWTDTANQDLLNQQIPITRLTLADLENSPIDWEQFSLNRPQDIKLKPKKKLKDHQQDALNSVKVGFEAVDRGKLIMACGTGKTFTSLKIAEDITPQNSAILFLAPSISLVSQTLREWTAQADLIFHSFVVCSDSQVGKDEEDIKTCDLAYPPTTDSIKLKNAFDVLSKQKRTVIFSTYQSIQVIADAQKQGLPEFDLIICDEAHRTTGIEIENKEASNFIKVHNQNVIKGKKRLYMTATPRIFGDSSKAKADEKNAILYSMDDKQTFGEEFYRLGFGKAVDIDQLTEYKVLIVTVRQDLMAKIANDYNAFHIEGKKGKKAIDTKFATKIIGSWKGLSKLGLMEIDESGQQTALDTDLSHMRRAVAFSKSIKDSKETKEIFADIVKLHPKVPDGTMIECCLDHVDGTMNALKRQNLLNWLKQEPEPNQCRILSNARCLSEGVDVPALDAVIFFDTRESIVDIVQSVGRVMRKSEGKNYGYIILPVAIPSEKVENYNAYIDSDPQFKGIWKVIKALRAHDESLVDEAVFRQKINIIDGGTSGGGDGGGTTIDIPMDFPDIPIDELANAVYAAIPKKLGDREYWAEWAKSVAVIAIRLTERIKSLLQHEQARESFDRFLTSLRISLNPSIGEDEAIEMLVQHTITRPIFDALFKDYSFSEYNPVSQAMQTILEVIDSHAVDSEIEELEKFYLNIRERISVAKSDKSRQDIIRNLYDTFFKTAFPRMSERLGIVYTPVEVVDFIIHSANAALQNEFNQSLGDDNIHIIDPFTGTGTFITRLLQSGLIKPEQLAHKYKNEIHANEIVLLAYYIATINIEAVYHEIMGGDYLPFNGIVLTDTFQLAEPKKDLTYQHEMNESLGKNSERANKQKQKDITVIIGNPPYSAGQTSENDNNQNQKYENLDNRIRETYAEYSTGTNKNSLYDSYIRAIRWASDRIRDRGILCYVSNGSFIDNNAMDGLRKCLMDEHAKIYCFNLRGNARTSGEQRRMEKGNVFGEGTRTPVAITLLIKNPQHQGGCELFYQDIGDYLDREEKLKIISHFKSISGIQWQKLTPNDSHDWINQRNAEFESFIAMGNKETGNTEKTIFDIYSGGIKTSRDNWCYNFSKESLVNNMTSMIEFYNSQMSNYENLSNEKRPAVENFISFDTKKISWSRGLRNDLSRFKKREFNKHLTVKGMYRPFCKQWAYFDKYFNDMVYQMPKIFPNELLDNLVIYISGIGAGGKESSALIMDSLPDLNLQHSGGQGFPLYTYELTQTTDNDNTTSGLKPQADMFGDATGDIFETLAEQLKKPHYQKKENITDDILTDFKNHYNDTKISKQDIFYYVYGVLHSPEYKQRFASDLKKMLPRIPFAQDFWVFSQAGRELAHWHLNYEAIEPYPLQETSTRLETDADHYQVQKMQFAKNAKQVDKSTIFYNGHITLSGIPLEAYDYIVNGKSAIEWIMERYAVTTDKDSGIKNDPNDWSENPRYILDLVKRIVRVSIETVQIVKALPALNEHIK